MGLLRDDRQDDINSQQTKEGLLREFKKYADDHHFITNWDFVRMVMDDINTLVLSLKFAFNRPRPDTLAQHQGILLSVEGDGTYHTPSYPSFHSTASRVVAEVIAGTYVGHKTELLRIADKIGMNRVIAGYHYLSDHQAGLLLANQLILKITTNLSINPVYEREETIDSKTAETVTENFMDTLEEMHRRGEAVKKEEDEGDYEDSYMAAVKMAIGRHADETAFMTDINKAKKDKIALGDIKYDKKSTKSPLLQALGNMHDAILAGAISAFSVPKGDSPEEGDMMEVVPLRKMNRYFGITDDNANSGIGNWRIQVTQVRPLDEVSREEDELNEGFHDYDTRVANDLVKIDFQPIFTDHFAWSVDEFINDWNDKHPENKFADPLGRTAFGIGSKGNRTKIPKGHKYNPQDDDFGWNDIRNHFGTLDRPTKLLDPDSDMNIYTNSNDALFAALTNFNSLSETKGNLPAGVVNKFHFSMDNFDDLLTNKFKDMAGQAERYPHESMDYSTDTIKRVPKGKLYTDVEEALGDIAGIGHYKGKDENGKQVNYQNAKTKPGWDADRLERLNTELIKAKLQANPRLHRAIQEYGGLNFIKSLGHHGRQKKLKRGWFDGGMWEGDGISSAMIRALGKAYHAIETPETQINRVLRAEAEEIPTLYRGDFVEEILGNPAVHNRSNAPDKLPQAALDDFFASLAPPQP